MKIIRIIKSVAIVFLLCLISGLVNGQNTHLIDPDNNETLPATLTTGHTYLIKRNSTLILSTQYTISVGNITIGAYDDPKSK